MEMHRSKYQPQIILIDEMPVDPFFHKANLEDTKNFFSGEGKIMEQKFKDPARKFIGSGVFITSNRKPLILKNSED